MSYNNNASQAVSNFITEKIQSGSWKPGERIWSETEFCQNLNVSRIAVRDAISSLSAMSVLKKVKGSGTYVEEIDKVALEGIRYFAMGPEEMLELMEFRYILDSYCTELFAQRATDEEIEQLEACYYKMLRSRGDAANYDFYANEFHLLIGRGSKNQFITRVMEYLRNSLLVHQNILTKDVDKQKYRIGTTYHYKMLQAIRARDAEMAGAYCRYHIRLSMQLYRDVKVKKPEAGLDDPESLPNE